MCIRGSMIETSPAFPQELLDLIADNVYAEVYAPRRKAHWADVLALLGTARCFGARCRKYIYRSVWIRLEITPRRVIDKTLNDVSLRFIDLLRHTPSLAVYVKNVSYRLYFELDDPDHITSTTAWNMLRELAPYLTHLNSVSVDFYDSRIDPSGYTMSLDSDMIKAIGQIIPSCPFYKLHLSQMDLLPFHIVDLLAYCPHVTSLGVEIVTDEYNPPGEGSAVVPSKKLEELLFVQADSFLLDMMSDEDCLALFAPLRRIVFASWDMTEHVWEPLGEFLPRLTALETVFFNLFHDDMDFDVRAFLHASSLCLDVIHDTPQMMAAISNALKQNPSYPSKLRRLALVIVPAPYGRSIDDWKNLVSALDQPRFAALETFRITFSKPFSEEWPYTVEDVARCFAGLTVKVDVRAVALEPAVYSYFDTLF